MQYKLVEKYILDKGKPPSIENINNFGLTYMDGP